MLELQKTTLSEPTINIINELSTKSLVIGLILLVVFTVSCILYFSPEVLYVTTAQLGKVNFIVSELLRYIPDSNSTCATIYLINVGLKIVTEITLMVIQLTPLLRPMV